MSPAKKASAPAKKAPTTAAPKAAAVAELDPQPAPSSVLPDAPVRPKLPVADVAPDPSPPEGHIGWSPSSAADNAAHSLATGPDAPPLQPDDRTRAVQPQLPKETRA